MKQQYLALVRKIRDAVREKAQEVPVFKSSGNGAIRILAYPMSKDADDWFGGLSTFYDRCGAATSRLNGCALYALGDDIVDYEYTFPITVGGSRVITGVWGGVEQKVDCYAFSALKIAHCSRAQDEGKGLLSGINLEDEHLTEDNGYGPYFGALCVEVKRVTTKTRIYNPVAPRQSTTQKDEPFCNIYVCVSGADSKDDLKCAFVAVDVIKKFFEGESELGCGFALNAPSINDLP